MQKTIRIIIALALSYFGAAEGSRSNATEALRHCWDAGKACDNRGVAIANCNGLSGVDLTSCTCGAESLYTPPVLFPCCISLSCTLVRHLSEDLRSSGSTELSSGLGCL
jgi:hypothetical protein